MTDSTPSELLALCILDLLAADSDDTLQDACDELCDYIANIDTNIFTQLEVNATMAAAHAIDNNESYHAAHIRDTFRDNHSYEGI